MTYDEWKLATPPYDDSDEVFVNCEICEAEHSIHNTNDVVIKLGDDGMMEVNYCNKCFLKHIKK